jgi:hypothetical protein
MVGQGEKQMPAFNEEELARPQWLGDAWADSPSHNVLPTAILCVTADGLDGPAIECRLSRSPGELDRYEFTYQRSWVVDDDADRLLYSGRDENAARQWARAAEIAKTIIAEVLQHPEWLTARSFSELHDRCDANVLGDQEAFLVSCGWTGADDIADEAALTASADVLNFAQSIVGIWLATRR